MNICILTHRYPYGDNMVHVFVKRLVDEWAKLGHTCVVVSPLSSIHVLMGKEERAPREDYYEVGPENGISVYRPRYFALPRLRIAGVSIDGAIRQRCVERKITKTGLKFDALYCHFFLMVPSVWRFAVKNEIPLFVATGESSMNAIARPCKQFTTDRMRETLCGIVAVSGKNKRNAIELGYAKEEDIAVFPNGANLSIFRKIDRLECRKRLGFPDDKFIVICVGQFAERKGQKRILAALDILKNNDIRTVFIGKGNDQFDHDSIIFKGTIKNVDLPIYLNAADVFVLPTRGEGCCNAIIEALACGLPIISSDRSFNYDVLNKENSILVDPDNTEAIAKAIDELYRNKSLRDFISSKSYAMGLRLSIEERAKSIIAFMQEKIKERAQQ